ncbi:MAG: SBBP repeat-containing protein [Terriglobia bacterium]
MGSKKPFFSSRGKALKQIIGVGACLCLGFGLLWTVRISHNRKGMAFTSPKAGMRSSAPQATRTSGNNHNVAHRNLLFQPGAFNRKGLKADQATRSRAAAGLGRLPIIFEPNEGQADPKVQFLARDSGLTMRLERAGAVLTLPSPSTPALPGRVHATAGPAATVSTATLRKTSERSSILRMDWVGGNRAAQVSGEQQLPGKTNYFIGNDPHHWRTNIPQFARVRYHDIYPGVDLVYYGSHGQLEYDFVVAPGGDPRAITLDVGAGLAPPSRKTVQRLHGRAQQAAPLRIDANGDLLMSLGGGKEVRFHKPVVYQDVAAGFSPALNNAAPSLRSGPALKGASTGAQQAAPLPSRAPGNPQSAIQNRKYLDGRYRVARNNQVSFMLGDYDKTKPVVIDPTLSYSTYLGGTNNDQADDVVLDSAGNIYIDGTTSSTDFPLHNAEQPTCSSCPTSTPDSFVTELSADGSKLIFSTYLGGSAEDDGNGIALDPSGNIYVTGRTFSTDFPVTPNAFQPTCASCTPPFAQPDAYVTELPPGGASLTYSTYLGGDGEDDAFGIAVDAAGYAHIVGRTASLHFPLQNPIQSTLTGTFNVFIAEFKPGGAELVYSTYLGGLGSDYGFAIAVDAKGNTYITGQTSSNNFPTTPGAFQTAFGGNQNVFVTKIKPSGVGLAYSTYLGGTGQDSGRAIAVDSAGNAYVDGTTSSSDFPVKNAAQANLGGGGATNAFIAKLSAAGSALIYSTYLGGSGQDIAGSIALDKGNRAYVTGDTNSTNFPLANALSGQSKYSGNQDAFITKLSPGGCGFAFSTYLGGISQDIANGIAVTPSGNPVIVGSTTSNDFPVTSHAIQGKTAGKGDVFVSTLTGLAGPVDCFSPATLKFSGQVVTTTSAAQTVTLTNDGEDPLSISSIGTSVQFAETNTCIASGTTSGTVPPGSNCAISLTFTPVAQGSQLGALTVTDSGPNSPHTITMTGTGQDFAFTANPPLVTISAGQQAQYTLTVSPLAGFNQTIMLTCSGAPPDGTCTLNPKSVTLDGTSAQIVTIAVATTARTAGVFPDAGPGLPPYFLRWKFELGALIFLAFSMLLFAAARRRSSPAARHAFRIGVVMFALLALMVLFWSSCGGNGTLPTGTPAGNYGITVTGTDGTLIHSGQLGLKVN